MTKKTIVLAAAGILAASPAFGSGYRIPEQSMSSVALSNAYVAHTQGADASYYNPANMSWLENKWQSEVSFTYINLSSIEYTDNNTPTRNGGSRTENFLMPDIHLVSPEYKRFRFGFSVIYPYGLSKRWDATFPRQTAEDFTLKVYEFNPTVSYKIFDNLSVGIGARAIHSTGEVKSFAGGGLISRDLDGDSTDYGYNLAISYNPTKQLSLAATYRSKVNLEIEGDARLRYGAQFYSGYAEVMIPAPAVLTLGTAYTWNQTTLEFVYDKTYWSAYDKLDFNYAFPLSGALGGAFDNPKAKNWVNTDAFRIGITHQLNTQWTLMAGFAIDKNPVPDNTLGFELPDSDAKLYSIGAKYRCNENLLLGISYLYDKKESRTITASNSSGINGTFDDAVAQLLSVGLQYRF